jgi:hypothetical protein
MSDYASVLAWSYDWKCYYLLGHVIFFACAFDHVDFKNIVDDNHFNFCLFFVCYISDSCWSRCYLVIAI